MSPFFEGSNSRDTSSNQYQASRLALSCLLSNWTGLSFMCHSRSLSELLGSVFILSFINELPKKNKKNAFSCILLQFT